MMSRSYEAIGLACLMANDLMLPFMPSPQDGTLERLANVLPFSDYMPHDQYPAEIARAQKMFDIASQEPDLASAWSRDPLVLSQSGVHQRYGEGAAQQTHSSSIRKSGARGGSR